MKSENKNKQVAEKIIDILQRGLMINADTLHYIDSTFSNPSIGELEELLQDESSCETDSLIELLFFPDESVQLQLEEILQRYSVSKAGRTGNSEYGLYQSLSNPHSFPGRQGYIGDGS